MGRTVDLEKHAVAWFPSEIPGRGEYRVVEQTTEAITLPDGSEQAFSVAVPGSLVTWVDDAPDDVEDGAGHFEYHAADPENYKPTVAGEERE